MAESNEQLTQNKAVVHRVIEEGFNDIKPEVSHEICRDDFLNLISIMPVPIGPEGLAQHIRNARGGAGAGNKLRARHLVADGDSVALAWITDGKNNAYFGGEVSEQRLSAWLIGFWRFEGDKLVEWVGNFEPIRNMAQTGGLDLSPLEGDPPYRHVSLADVGGITNLAIDNYPGDADGREITEVRVPSAAERAEVEGLVRTFLDAELVDSSKIDDLPLSDDAYLFFADHDEGRGAAGLRDRAEAFQGAFGEAEVTIDKLLVEQGRAAVRFTVTCRQVGPYLGIVATGRPVTFTGSAIASVVDGKVAQWIEVSDFLTLMREVGGLTALLRGCSPVQ